MKKLIALVLAFITLQSCADITATTKVYEDGISYVTVTYDYSRLKNSSDYYKDTLPSNMCASSMYGAINLTDKKCKKISTYKYEITGSIDFSRAGNIIAIRDNLFFFNVTEAIAAMGDNAMNSAALMQSKQNMAISGVTLVYEFDLPGEVIDTQIGYFDRGNLYVNYLGDYVLEDRLAVTELDEATQKVVKRSYSSREDDNGVDTSFDPQIKEYIIELQKRAGLYPTTPDYDSMKVVIPETKKTTTTTKVSDEDARQRFIDAVFASTMYSQGAREYYVREGKCDQKTSARMTKEYVLSRSALSQQMGHSYTVNLMNTVNAMDYNALLQARQNLTAYVDGSVAQRFLEAAIDYRLVR